MLQFILCFWVGLGVVHAEMAVDYSRLMQVFGRTVRVLGETAAGRGTLSEAQLLTLIQDTRELAIRSAEGQDSHLLPPPSRGFDLEAHSKHMQIFAEILSEAERVLCESKLSGDLNLLKEIEIKLWQAADEAHKELFAGQSGQSRR